MSVFPLPLPLKHTDIWLPYSIHFSHLSAVSIITDRGSYFKYLFLDVLDAVFSRFLVVHHNSIHIPTHHLGESQTKPMYVTYVMWSLNITLIVENTICMVTHFCWVGSQRSISLPYWNTNTSYLITMARKHALIKLIKKYVPTPKQARWAN